VRFVSRRDGLAVDCGGAAKGGELAGAVLAAPGAGASGASALAVAGLPATLAQTAQATASGANR